MIVPTETTASFSNHFSGGIGTVLVTITLLMGEDGSVTFDGGRIVRPRRRPRVEVVDPIGAGDAYVAGFLWAAQRGADLEQTVDTATADAALECSIWGDVAVITPRDVDDVLAGGPGVRR